MVTVLMSVYDTPAALLDRAIESVRRQTFSDFEFLILDDGSQLAETRERLAEAALLDARIRLRWETHRGLTATLNLGLAEARGEFIARQDADDWSEPRRLERQIAFVEEHPEIALVGSAAWTHQHDGTPLWLVRMPETHSGILTAFWYGNPFVHGSVLFRTETAREAGGYREQLRCSQDYDFFWRLSEAGGAANLAEPLYHYRYTVAGISAARAAEQARGSRAARQLAAARYRGVPEDIAQALAADWRPEDALRASLKQADHLTLAGDYRQAARAYGELLRSRPWSPFAWAKFARLGIFRVAPSMREICFR
jgi:glycosyltransferase involved in cell wall biosynthesis